jgi:uncharacterized Rmd1/YagE family protein
MLISSVFTPYSFKYPISPPRDNGESNSVPIIPKVFLFDYGVVVFWGMTLEEEQKFMREIEPFEEERLGMYFYRHILCVLLSAQADQYVIVVQKPKMLRLKNFNSITMNSINQGKMTFFFEV